MLSLMIDGLLCTTTVPSWSFLVLITIISKEVYPTPKLCESDDTF